MQKYTDALAVIRTKQAAIRTNFKRASDDVATEEENLNETMEAIKLCNLCLAEQVDLITYIEGIVNAILVVFFEGRLIYKVTPILDADGVITGLTPKFIRDGVEIGISQEGGGARNLATFGHRYGLLLYLSKKLGVEPMMFLDEQLMNLDVDRWELLVEFLAELLNELAANEGLQSQIFFILHTPINMPQVITLVPGRSETKVVTTYNEV